MSVFRRALFYAVNFVDQRVPSCIELGAVVNAPEFMRPVARGADGTGIALLAPWDVIRGLLWPGAVHASFVLSLPELTLAAFAFDFCHRNF